MKWKRKGSFSHYRLTIFINAVVSVFNHIDLVVPVHDDADNDREGKQQDNTPHRIASAIALVVILPEYLVLR